jgi:hypothetical protein
MWGWARPIGQEGPEGYLGRGPRTWAAVRSPNGPAASIWLGASIVRR